MKNLILRYLKSVLLFIVIFSFNTETPAQVDQPHGYYTPRGLFDTVFDGFGNKYSIGEIAINDTVRSAARGSSVEAMIAPSCSSGYFQLYLDAACGMENFATDPVHNARLQVLCKVLYDISQLIPSPCTSTGQKVNIWVKHSTVGGALGAATPFFSMPSSLTKSGIVDNAAWLTINSGHDAYENVTSGFFISGGTTFFHASIQFDFGGTIPWHTNLTTTPGIVSAVVEQDLYTVALHEMMHALGFVSNIHFDGRSVFDYLNTSSGVSNYRYYSRYDQYLKVQGTPMIPLITSTSTCTPMYQCTFNPSLTASTILAPGTHAICTGGAADHTNTATAIKYVGSTTQYVFTPDCFKYGNSISHFEDEYNTYLPGAFTVTPSNNQYFLMSDRGPAGAYNATTNPGVMKRYPTPEERQVLCDMGYAVNTSFGDVSGVNLNYINYGGSACPGLGVAGVNDGISAGTYTYFSTGGPVTITSSSVLGNDYGVIGGSVSCMEVVIGLGVLTSSAGTFTYTPGVTDHGIVLLRYLPTSASGTKGNITYVYVYVGDVGCTPSACNIVSNGDFESTYSCWQSYCGSPDYFHRGFISTFGIPNTTGFTYTDVHPFSISANNDFGALGGGSAFGSSGLPFTEGLSENLLTGLVSGTQYTISFWGKLTDLFPSTTMHLLFAVSPSTALTPVTPYRNSVPAGLIPLDTFVVRRPDTGWHYYSDTVTYVGPTTNSLIVMNMPWSDGSVAIYGILDDIRIFPTVALCSFTLPAAINVCLSGTGLINLDSYVSIPGGTWSWHTMPVTGIAIPTISHSNMFDPLAAYMCSIAQGNHGLITICYDYIDALGCPRQVCKDVQLNSSFFTVSSTPLPYCSGTTLTLTCSGFASSSYVWSPAVTCTAPCSTATTIPTATTIYTVTESTTGCSEYVLVRVYPSPLPIIAPTTLCVGVPTAFSDPTPGGIWSGTYAGFTGVFLYDAAGVVTGTAPGTGQMVYTLYTLGVGCATTATFTIYPSPAVITGSITTCVGVPLSLSNSTVGGTWSSSNTGIATVGSTTGIVTGISGGVVIITYMIGGGCTATLTVTITTPPPITGITTICVGSTSILSNAIPGGTWSSGNTTIISTGSAAGDITGLSTGDATVTYTLPTGCLVTTTVTVRDTGTCTPCNEFGGASYTTITGLTISTSLGAGNYYLDHDIIVSANVVFTDAVILIAPGVHIYVNPISSLTLVGSHLYCCGGMWAGIELLSNFTRTGKVTLRGNVANKPTLIEDAIIGVNVQSPVRPNGGGYYVNSNNAVFNRNNIGISIGFYTPVTSSSVTDPMTYEFHIENTVFTNRDFSSASYPLSWPKTTGPGGLKTYIATSVYNAPYNVVNYPYAACHNYVAGQKTTGILLEQVGHRGLLFAGMVIGEKSNMTIFSTVNMQLNLFDTLNFGIKGYNSNLTSVNNAFAHMEVSGPQTKNPHDMGGVGIYTARTDRGQYLLNVTPAYYIYWLGMLHITKSINSFYNCKYGVYSLNYSRVTGRESYMITNQDNSPPTGIHSGNHGYDIQTWPFDFVGLTDNTITNVANGIVVKMLTGGPVHLAPPVGQVSINNNIVQATVPGGALSTHYVDKAIWVDNAVAYILGGTFTPSTQVNVNDNKLRNVYNGIYINGVIAQQATSNSNNIKGREYPAGNGPTQFGIWHVNCANDKTRNNTITGTNYTNDDWRGVLVSNSFFHTVTCNSVTATGRGFEFENSHISSTWKGNNMTNNGKGFVLTGGQIGVQGANHFPSDNRWLATGGFAWSVSLGNYQTYTDFANPVTSTLWVRSGPTTDPVNNFGIGTGGVSDWYGFGTGVGNGLAISGFAFMDACPTMGGVSVMNAAQLGRISKRLMGYTTYIRQHDWMGQYGVWQAMLQNASLDSSAVLHAFRTMAAHSRFNLCTDVENDIADGNNAGATTLLDSHPVNDLATTDTDATTGVRMADDTAVDANQIVQNYRRFYRIYISYKDSVLTGTDSTDIETLASLCPLTNGAVVYKARALYDIMFDTVRIFENNCDDTVAARIAHFREDTAQTTGIVAITDAKGQKYMLFPNPNDGNFILQQSTVDNEPVQVEIWDAVGRSIHKERLHFTETTTKLHMRNVASGLYLLQITDNKSKTFRFKFVVE